ncbi:PP2C family protein-serine/threonine phosphatase [Streptacidiphilus sp. N1-12]|uniref:PP2C family protein-serine/threonine phosphatase n=2 Tax=Streptacidiphilus alkalitolerans TaxID=3342712 RepID=A0ABV6W7M5_9ACTN
MTSTPEREGAAGEKARGYPLTATAGRDYWRASGLDRELRAVSARISGYRGRRRVDPVRLRAELNRTLFQLEDTERQLRACLRVLEVRADRAAETGRAALRRLDTVCRITALLVDERQGGEAALLDGAVRLLAEEFGARVSAFLADGTVDGAAGEEAPHEVATAGREGGLRQVLTAAASAADRVHRTGRPLLRPGAVLGVPLCAGGRTIGSLIMLRSDDFVIQELGLVQELGRQLALALWSERRRRQQADAAQLLQSSLLPAALPSVPGVQVAAGYLPPRGGAAVGGDFYDVFPVRDGWGLLLGDICGKGEEAAAVTAVVRHGTRALSVWEPCPERVLEQVGQVMALQNTTDRFATAVFARLRFEPTCGPGAVRLGVASAGHLPAAVVRADGEVSFLKGGGCPIGIAGLSEVAVEETVLQAGDALLLYSDGATEARDREGRFFDERGLAAVLAETAGMSAEALVRAVEQRVLDFAGGAPQDDMALLAVRVDPDPADPQPADPKPLDPG